VQLKRQAEALAANPASAALQRMQQLANASTRAVQLKHHAALSTSGKADASPVAPALAHGPVQRMPGHEASQGYPGRASPTGRPSIALAPLEKKPNRTGLPDRLKTGIESLSGMSMDHVRVHYNSAKPAQLQAHAFAQGNEIHVASGQERHLPHEAWHVVQQAQGRVAPILLMKSGLAINDDSNLEKEADSFGAMASQFENSLDTGPIRSLTHSTVTANVKRNVSQAKTNIEHKSKNLQIDGKDYVVGKKMEATLDVADPIMGSATGQQWIWTRALGYKYRSARIVRGHLLNHDLGGEGAPCNLYPISSSANAEHSSKVEQNVKELLNKAAEENIKANNTVLTKDKDEFYVKYKVEVVEATPGDPQKVTFNCDWTYKNKKEKEPITSDLSTRSAPYSPDAGLRADKVRVEPHKDWSHKKKFDIFNSANHLGLSSAGGIGITAPELANIEQLKDEVLWSGALNALSDLEKNKIRTTKTGIEYYLGNKQRDFLDNNDFRTGLIEYYSGELTRQEKNAAFLELVESYQDALVK
jgi:hypothetical protein